MTWILKLITTQLGINPPLNQSSPRYTQPFLDHSYSIAHKVHSYETSFWPIHGANSLTDRALVQGCPVPDTPLKIK